MSGLLPTPEQTAVITTGLDPVRVAAGAGTGKTTTIALRVAHLVTQCGLEPERILGLTFTNKAAAELADRIREHLRGVIEPGREAEVHTYHGFAAHILAEFGALVGLERRAQVITPTFSRQLLTEVISSTPLPAVSISSPGLVEEMRRLGSALGDHLLEPEDVAIPEFAPGDPWELRADLLKGLRVYQAQKRRLGVADYSDLVVMAYRLVSQHDSVRDEIRERYRAVMLDEYQDTNPAQREFLRALFPPGSAVTAVGDVDQTIYEWRGASPHNFEQFPHQFPQRNGEPASTKPLTENRRSRSRIVEVANAVRAMARSGQDPLVPLAGHTGGEVVVAWHDDAVVEADWIARRLTAMHEVHRWKDMAVLFRKNKDMVLVHDALRAAGIPVEVANVGGLLSVPEVAELHAWLRVLERPEDTPALYRILMGGRLRLGMGDVVHLYNWARQRADADPDQEEHGEIPAQTLVEAIDHLDDLTGLRPEARAALDRFRDEYRELLSAAQGVSLVELCRRILDRTGAWNDLAALPENEQLTARLNLYRFLDLTEDWSPLEGRSSLPAFLTYLSLMQQDRSEELDTARLSGEDAVTLMTVHRAKGLEWEVVFIPACYKDNFPSTAGANENPYRSGKYLPYEYRLDRQWLPPIDADMDDAEAAALLKEIDLRQEWRIAYVATTRAKQTLLVSGAFWYGSPEPRKRPVVPSALWELVRSHPVATVESIPGEPPPAPSLLRLEPPAAAPDPLFGRGWDAALRDELATPGHAGVEAEALGLAGPLIARTREIRDFLSSLPAPVPGEVKQATTETSVTGLVTYALCPQRFYWTDVDRLPRMPNAAAQRGTAIHRAIELHHLGQVPPDDAGEGFYDLPEQLDDTPPPLGGPYATFLASRFASSRPVLIEAGFSLSLDGLGIKGRIDAIYDSPAPGWEVVDFKSGRRPPPNDHGSRNVQLQAYAVAVDDGMFGQDRPDHLVTTFAYLGGGLEEVSDVVDGPWLDVARRRLSQLAEGILSQRFDPTPSPACHGCDFLRFCPAGQRFVEQAVPA